MVDIIKVADTIDKKIRDRGIDKAGYSVVSSKTSEISAETGELTMLRTVYYQGIHLTIINDKKKGYVQGSDLSEAGIDELISSAVSAADAVQADDANDIAPKEEDEVFEYGVYEPDMLKFMFRINELLKDVREQFPKVNIRNIYASHTQSDTVYRNTNGSDMRQKLGQYSVGVSYSASDGNTNTGMDDTGITVNNLDKPFMEIGDFREKFTNAEKQLETVELRDKFKGTVIMCPDCVRDFFSSLINNYLGNNVIIDGTSKWVGKLDEKLVDERITVTLDPKDERIVSGENITYDGFKTQRLPIIEKGVLKNYVIDLYTANKTGNKVSKNTGFDCVFESGDSSLDEMIKSTKKGLYLGGFSGGDPSTSGEFSGVAKNSFYIENGEIKGAVNEVMINGILDEMFNNVNAVSKELMEDGVCVVPYISVDGIVISGK